MRSISANVSRAAAFCGALLAFAALTAAEPPNLLTVPAAVSFSKNVAPIFQKRCQTCHRPGETAPMSLLSYGDARPYADSIKEEVSGRRMPPWHADPKHGKFKNDPTLSQEEVDTIKAWVDGGSVEGDPKNLPPPIKFTDGWRLGTPDAVFTMEEEFHVPAKGEVEYQYFEIPTNFTEDRWISAVEARPGSRAVVHHILVFHLDPVEGEQRGGRKGLARFSGNIFNVYLAGAVPGGDPAVFPEGTGRRIKAGSTLVFQVHYTPNGKETTDRSQVGLFFAKTPPKTELVTRAVLNQLFVIPPGAPAFEVGSEYTFRKESTVLSFMPHMHLRGKSFEYVATYPDGTQKTLLSVPRYDFNWQHTYYLEEPLDLPAGTKIRCVGTYDNSAGNKSNPDPRTLVRWGDQTWEEMMIGFVTFTRALPSKDEKNPAAPSEGENRRQKL